MKPFIALLVATLIAGLRPAEAAETPFAEYWVPQSDGQTIVSFYLGRRELKPGRFIARYKNLYRDKTGVTAQTMTALARLRLVAFRRVRITKVQLPIASIAVDIRVKV